MKYCPCWQRKKGSSRNTRKRPTTSSYSGKKRGHRVNVFLGFISHCKSLSLMVFPSKSALLRVLCGLLYQFGNSAISTISESAGDQKSSLEDWSLAQRVLLFVLLSRPFQHL